MNDLSFASVIRQLVKSSKWGVAALLMVNMCAAFTKVSLGFGWLSGCVAVGLGAPGVVALLILNAIVGIG